MNTTASPTHPIRILQCLAWQLLYLYNPAATYSTMSYVLQGQFLLYFTAVPLPQFQQVSYVMWLVNIRFIFKSNYFRFVFNLLFVHLWYKCQVFVKTTKECSSLPQPPTSFVFPGVSVTCWIRPDKCRTHFLAHLWTHACFTNKLTESKTGVTAAWVTNRWYTKGNMFLMQVLQRKPPVPFDHCLYEVLFTKIKIHCIILCPWSFTIGTAFFAFLYIHVMYKFLCLPLLFSS